MSCSPARRLARLEKNHPELFKTEIKIDTVIRQTTKVDTVFADTTFMKSLNDTIFIVKDRVSTKIYRDTITKEIGVVTECKGDTIYVPSKTIWKTSPPKNNYTILCVLIGVVLFLGTIIVVRK